MNSILQIGNACVGCRSCEQSCPMQCITMVENQEGFLYPCIDDKKCINCGKCLVHCPEMDREIKKHEVLGTYGLKHKDKDRIINSASGGASDAFAQYIIKENGIVFGCAYDENMRAHHIEIDNIDELWKIQSSKYVQSDLEDSYYQIENYLEKGKKVLFTGTPCQIGGLYAYLGEKKYDNLYTVDLICHGVPSPKFWHRYIEYMEDKMKGKIVFYDFRSKDKRGWGTSYKTKTKTKTKTGTVGLDKYGKHFMAGDCYRESCYICKYANTNRVADITIGDFWGVEKIAPKFFSRDGVSVVLVNSEKGNELLCKSNIEYIEVNINEVKKKQGNLNRPTERLVNRDVFYDDIDKDDYIRKMKIGIELMTRIKNCMPETLIRKLKSIR